ncbi:MAG: methyl-accepting chemotaxis protein [Thermodesulfobacteriota bacterium]|nr:methyl-accepting chemotaxis protein [Thermodesulfobacteriota bacterium]
MVLKRKKLNLKVKRDLQVWLLVRILGTIMISSVIAALILYFYARREIGGNFYQAHVEIRRVSDLLLPVIGVGSLVSFLSGLAIAIFLPQKIAGPIFRIESDLKAVEQGDLTKQIMLRSKDIMHDLSGSINTTVGSLRAKFQDVKLYHAELEKYISEDNKVEIAKSLAKQRETLDKLQT